MIVAVSLHKTHIHVVKSLVKIAAVSWHNLRRFIKPAPGDWLPPALHTVQVWVRIKTWRTICRPYISISRSLHVNSCSTLGGVTAARHANLADKLPPLYIDCDICGATDMVVSWVCTADTEDRNWLHNMASRLHSTTFYYLTTHGYAQLPPVTALWSTCTGLYCTFSLSKSLVKSPG